MRFEQRPFLVEDFFEVKEHLIQENYDETAPKIFDINPDIYFYLAEEPLVFIAVEDEKIVGYSIFFIREHAHYQRYVAYQDVMYIHPDHRKGMTGYKFIKYIEGQLKDTEAEAILLCHSVLRDLSPIFKRLGYSPIEVTYAKEI